MLIALAIATLARPASVTLYETATLEHLLADLAAKTGQPMRAIEPVKSEVLLINVHDASLEQVCDQIAKAADAEWKKTNTEWILSRGIALERKLAAQAHERRLAMWQRAQKNKREELAAAAPFDENEAGKLWKDIDNWYSKAPDVISSTNDQRVRSLNAWEALMQRAPRSRAMDRFIANVDLTRFADLPERQRIVLGDPPTRMQQPLGPEGKTLWKDLDEMLDIWQAEAKKHGVPHRDFINSGDPTEPPRQAGRRLVVVSADQGGAYLLFRLWQYTPDAQWLTESIGWLEAELEDPNQKPTPDGTGKPFLGNAETQAAADGMKAPLSAEWRERLLHPEKTDPLSYQLGPDIAELARQKQRDIVALLPDAINWMPRFMRFRKYAASNYWKQLGVSGLRFEDDGHTLVGHTIDPIRTTEERTRRSDLRALLLAVSRQGLVDLDSLAAFVAHNTLTAYQYLAVPSAELLTPGSTRDTSTQDESMLRLYGRLNTDQRAALAAGRSIPLDTLPAEQQAIVENMVFFSVSPPLMTMRAFDNGAKVKGKRTNLDTTELLPNGLARGSQLHLEPDSELSVMTVSSQGGRTSSSAHDLSELVQYALIPSNTGGWPAYRDRVQKWAAAPRRRLRFVFDLSPTTAFQRELADVVSLKEKDAVPYDQLPAEVRKQIEGAMAAEAKKRVDLGFNPVRKNPPP